jgi:tetratricopeptide (TPR) repeat protein
MFLEYVGGLPPERRAQARAEAIELAERIFRTHPKHPGSTHYLIHAADDPQFAARGLEAARSYAKLAPDAEHALHMPSHIFLQLGLWDDVVSSNERAWAASRAEVIARKLSPAELSFHALQWLQYGYLQQGRYGAAKALIDTARAVLRGADLAHPDARYTVGWLEFTHAAQSGDFSAFCNRERSVPPLSQAPSERERSFYTVAVYQAAVAAVRCGDADAPAVQYIRSQLQALPASDPGRALLLTAQLHVDALVANRRGDYARVVELLTPSARAPARPPVGPPPLLRTNELLGAALLQAGRASAAVAEYQRALELTPNRGLALLGLARARLAAGDPAGAATAYQQLLAAWHNADAGIAALGEARAGAERK